MYHMKFKLIFLALLVISLSSFSQQSTIFEQRLGERGVMCLTGFSLSIISATTSPQYKGEFFKNTNTIIPFCFGVSLFIGGIIPDKEQRFYARKHKNLEFSDK